MSLLNVASLRGPGSPDRTGRPSPQPAGDPDSPRCWLATVNCGRSRTASTAGSCPNGSTSTSNAKSIVRRSRDAYQTSSRERRRLDLPLPQRLCGLRLRQQARRQTHAEVRLRAKRDEVHDKWIILQQRAREGPVATKAPILASYLDYWLREVIDPNRAPATFDNYERFVRLYIRPGLGDRRLNRLQVRDVQMWINRVAVACQCCAQGKDAARPERMRRCCARMDAVCCQDRPSPRMVSDIRNTLRSAASHAISEELLTRNVASPVKLPPIRKHRGKAWSSEEARRFLESARDDDDPLYAAYVLVLVLGLRRGEVLRLCWSDIDLARAELTIGLQLQRIRRQLHHRATKTEGSDATLPLPPICVMALRQRAERAAICADGFRANVAAIRSRVHHSVRPAC